MTAVHSIPESLGAWLAGWRASQRTGNPYLKVGADIYSVFPNKRRGGWTASVGRTFVNVSWPDAESAKAGLYDIVREAGPERLAAMHAGEDRPARDRRDAPARGDEVIAGAGNNSPGRDAPAGADQVEPETLLALPRERVEVRLERRTYEGRGFLALVVYEFGPKGPRQAKLISIRFGEGLRLAEAIRAACVPGRALADQRRPQRAPWDGAALPAPPSPDGGQTFDEFQR
jgi:hypothetical protein